MADDSSSMFTFTPDHNSYLDLTNGYTQSGDYVGVPNQISVPTNSTLAQSYGDWGWEPMSQQGGFENTYNDPQLRAETYRMLGFDPKMIAPAANNDSGNSAQYDFSGLPQLYVGGHGPSIVEAAFDKNGGLQGKPHQYNDDGGGWLGPLIQDVALAFISSGIGAAVGGAGAGAGDGAATSGASTSTAGEEGAFNAAQDSQAYNASLGGGGLDSSGAYAGGSQVPNTVNMDGNTYLTNTGTYTNGTWGGLDQTSVGQAAGRAVKNYAYGQVEKQAGLTGQPQTRGGDSMNGNGGSAGQDLYGGLGALYGMYQGNRAANQYIQNLAGMYGPNSPYASQLRQALMRQDAASGRRSQYGPREVELQARLAGLMSQNANPIWNAQLSKMGMNANGVSQLYPLLVKYGPSLLHTFGGWLGNSGGGGGGSGVGSALGGTDWSNLNLGNFGDGMDYSSTSAGNPFAGMMSGDSSGYDYSTLLGGDHP